MMSRFLIRCAAAAALLLAAAPAAANSILFVGNSFTYAGHSAVWKYRPDLVTDLAGTGVGGVPALFKRFADEAGLDYQVSLETAGGKSLAWHWDNRRDLVDRAWDEVVLQEYSTLDKERPGDPASLIDMSGRFAALFRARNPAVGLALVATWTRPDQVFQPGGHWFGHSVFDMANELYAGTTRAAAKIGAGAPIPAGVAFNCAIRAGVADPNPYDGIGFGLVDLWTFDHYHASIAGSYLEALTIFGRVTGRDPRTLGADEVAAKELGLSPELATSLQAVAADVLAGGCTG